MPARLGTRIMRKSGSSRASANGPGKRSCPRKRTSGPRATATVARAITTRAHASRLGRRPARHSATPPASGEEGEDEAGEQVVGVRRAEGRGHFAPDVVPGAGGQERLEGGGERRRLLRPAHVAQRLQRGAMQEIERKEGGRGHARPGHGQGQPRPAAPEEGQEGERQHEQADHAVVPAGVGLEREQRPRGQRVARAARRGRSGRRRGRRAGAIACPGC